MTQAQWGTYGNSTTGYTLTLGSGTKPEQTPGGLITTRAVETKKGWRGHVIIDKEIVYETKPKTNADDAMKEVNRYVMNRVKALFSPPTSRADEKDDEDA